MPLKIAVLCSGSGSNFQAVLDHCLAGDIPGEVVGLAYNRKQAYAAERARNAGIPAAYINKKMCGGADAFEAALLRQLDEWQPDLVVLAGWLEILGKAVTARYAGRIINIHPSLIPSFCGKGFYGHFVHEAVIAYGAKISGCTVHFVTEGADEGPIIMQTAVPVLACDTPDTLAARILPHEHVALPRAVKWFCQGRLRVIGRTVHILEDNLQEDKL